KSLPSLRALNVAATKAESVSPSRIVQRSVHSSSKQNQTTLLNSKKSEFSLMSLNTLKIECRKRGLKVSGRKSDLVSRVTAYESSFSSQTANSINTAVRPKTQGEIKINSQFQKEDPSSKKNITTNTRPDSGESRKFDVKSVSKNPIKKLESKLAKTFTKTVSPEAKGDDSHIDFIKPVDVPLAKSTQEDYVTQIPSLSTKASETPVTSFEKTLKKTPVNPNATIISKAEGSDAKIFENSSIDQIDIQNEQASKVTSDVFDNHKHEEGPYKWENSKFSSNEKTTFFGALAAVGLWWSLKPSSDLEKKK
ncbi:hypothetical protein WICPIJ_008908, partial [Wickerhamomyces pijperi]